MLLGLILGPALGENQKAGEKDQRSGHPEGFVPPARMGHHRYQNHAPIVWDPSCDPDAAGFGNAGSDVGVTWTSCDNENRPHPGPPAPNSPGRRSDA